MCQNSTKRFRLVEVQTTSATQLEYSLKDEEVLKEAKRITAIEAYRVGNVSNVPGSGRAVVSNAVFAKAFLTLSTADGIESVDSVPLADLDKAANNGQLFRLDIPPLAPSKCKITLANTTGVVLTESILLGFHYEK